MSNEASRKAFEANWAARRQVRYRHPEGETHWQTWQTAWQASRKAMEAEQAQIDDLRIQLARRAVERDMAIQMATCSEQAHTVDPVWNIYRAYACTQVTHWMPLPQPPQGENT